MNKIYKFIIALICIATVATNAFSQTWETLGNTAEIFRTAGTGSNSICTDTAGNVYAISSHKNSKGNYFVAKWDGIIWTEVGGLDALKANDTINSIAMDSYGNLYAAGNFKNNVGVTYVAKWNGIEWKEVYNQNHLLAVKEIDHLYIDENNNIYVSTISVYAIPYLKVQKFNGSYWSVIGGNTSLFAGKINAIITDSVGSVYVGGTFRNANLNYYVAKYDSTGWNELGGLNALGANGVITSLCKDPLGNIYAAGDFTLASNGRQVAKWNGVNWSYLALPIIGFTFGDKINSICSDGLGNIYATASSNYFQTYRIAKWNGSAWTLLGSSPTTYSYFNFDFGVKSLFVDNANNLFVAGGYNSPSKITDTVLTQLGGNYALKPDVPNNNNNPPPPSINSIIKDNQGNIYAGLNKGKIAEWNGVNWTTHNFNVTQGNINAICKDTAGNIYAAGSMRNSNSRLIYKLSNGVWTTIGSWANGDIYNLCADNNGNIYAAGDFTNTSGKWYVAKYNGTTWSELGGLNALNANDEISTICVDLQGNLYAYIYASGNVKKWNGATWTNIGGPAENTSPISFLQKRIMCTDPQGNLYITGYFTDVTGKRYVAKWNGTSWSTVGNLGINNDVLSMTCDSTGTLYIGGKFYYSSGNATQPYYLAKYDGTTWLPIGGYEGLYANGIINTIYVDAHGVYAAGEFTDKLGNYCIVSKYGCNSNLSPVVSVASSSSQVEVGTPVTFTATISNISNSYTLQWLINGVPIQGMNANTFVSDALVSSDLVTCQLTTTANCSSAITVNSNAISVTINQVAGSNWEYLGGATSFSKKQGPLYCDVNGNVYVTLAGNDIVKWDGQQYKIITGNSLPSNYYGLYYGSQYSTIEGDANGNIYQAYGNVYLSSYTTSQTPVVKIRKYNGSIWQDIESANSKPFNEAVKAITIDNAGNIYVGGFFTNGANSTLGKCYVAKWNGTDWIELPLPTNTSTTTAGITSLSHDAYGNIYATGGFKNTTGNYYVAKWNGTVWTELGGRIA